MPSVKLTQFAREDLLDIWMGIAANNPAAADRILARLERRIRILEMWPMAGPARPEIANEARLLVERPYLILYRLVPGGTQVVRVLHGARDIGFSLFREGIRT